MQSRASSVKQYLAELPADRRRAIETVRRVFLENVDENIEEGMAYGMIGYSIPHRVYPAGYHCDPSKPLPYAGIASQKGHMSLYLSCLYGNEEQARWFENAWRGAGKKLDMGKSCVRFKSVDDLALDVLAEAIRRTPSSKYIAFYESVVKRPAKVAAKPPAKSKVAPKPKATSARPKAAAPKPKVAAKGAVASKRKRS